MKFAIAVCAFTVTAIILIFLLQQKGVDYYKTRAEEMRLKEELRKSREENEQLKKEIYLLKTDPFYLEKYARDTFGLAASNEIIFKFDD